MSRPHIGIHFGQNRGSILATINVLQFGNARTFGYRAVSAHCIQRIVPIVCIVKVICKFLMSRFVRNVGHASHFHTVSCLLLVFVLECVLVEIYRLWTVILRRGLLLIDKLIVNTLEATTANVLSGQQFVNGASIVSRSQLKLL